MKNADDLIQFIIDNNITDKVKVIITNHDNYIINLDWFDADGKKRYENFLTYTCLGDYILNLINSGCRNIVSQEV